MNVTKAVTVVCMAGALLCSGCASILSESQYPVTINSHPDGATILVKDERGLQLYRGKTPTTLTLKSGEAYFHGKEYTVTFSKDGYEEQTAFVTKALDGWYIGNIVFGGLIGILIVDPLTGAMWKLSPKYLTVTLAEKVSAVDSDVPDVVVLSVDEVPEHLRQHLVRVE
jgi:hypothetical protein